MGVKLISTYTLLYANLPEYSDILTLSLNLVYVSQQIHFGVFFLQCAVSQGIPVKLYGNNTYVAASLHKLGCCSLADRLILLARGLVGMLQRY